MADNDLSDHIKINQDIWPLERDIMSRPERAQYVRKIIQPDGCVFCRSIANKEDDKTHFVLHRSKHCFVILNRYPYNNGHLLVLSQRHIGDMGELSDEEYIDLNLLVRKSVSILQKVYQCEGLNLGVNHGKVAGAGIPDHLHYHIIPRWAGDTNFFPLIAQTKVVLETLEQTYDLLQSYFEEITTVK